jgi:polyisoprenoid-binding protein YceI
LEVIEAKSEKLQGIINIDDRSFALMIDINSFEGFSTPFYKRLFNENYMESTKYQQATFVGKIIEKRNLEKDGAYTLRAKGKLKIHGVEQERIIKSQVSVKDGTLNFESSFSVFLNDHDITLPKIVQQKISEEIQVNVKGQMRLK